MAYKPALTIDIEDDRIRQCVYSLYHNILHDYISRANEQDVLNGLYKFFSHADIVIISRSQLKQYQEMEKAILTTSPLENKNAL